MEEPVRNPTVASRGAGARPLDSHGVTGIRYVRPELLLRNPSVVRRALVVVPGAPLMHDGDLGSFGWIRVEAFASTRMFGRVFFLPIGNQSTTR